MSNTLSIIDQLQQQIHTCLSEHLPSLEQGYALLDFPNYANIGDSAIWLGQIAYFIKHHQLPAYITDNIAYKAHDLKTALPKGPILIQGGGNFGDLWLQHQNMREQVLRDFPDRAVVQLPQSIHYNDPANIEKTAELIKQHGNFTMLVRDQKSYDLVTKHFDCKVALCPDMAFYIGALQRKSPICPALMLMRKDQEQVDTSAFEGFSIPQGAISEDWPREEASFVSDVKKKVTLKLPFILGLKCLNPAARREFFYRTLAQTRLERGIEILSKGESVITDRLHGHILSLLLDIPHTVLDNSYGKVSGFHAMWTHDSDIVTLLKRQNA